MAKDNTIDEFLRQFFSLLPEDMRRFRVEIERNVRAALVAALKRMELVTREEFDVQVALLSRTRAVLNELEQKIAELEKELEQRGRQD
ncbi:MAG: accessory factor UbiK family protein [Gammaproteobacteria bacterium]|nr:accessory factor UbiK family protein [Gammaproteobacteria bacterium]